MQITLRPFDAADSAAAVDMFAELNRHEATVSGDRRTDINAAHECFDEMLADAKKGAVVTVAEVEGIVAGLMVWAAGTDHSFVVEAFSRFGRVDDIVVAERFRGRGIGAALLAEAERLTRAAGMKRLRLTVLSGNDPAIAAYERFGFRDYARVMVRDFD
jgi:ribosomal protein S18 acetylase RimI-like enzyme